MCVLEILAMAKPVMVFDFDKTIIDCDSDNWVIEQLGVDDLFTELLPTLPWNHLMDRMMMELHSRGKTIQDIAECLRKIPLHPRMISAIKSAKASGCDLRILSDSNDFFIETVLKHKGLLDCFSEINTNPSYFDAEGRLGILQNQDFNRSSSHSCTICPPNMCKGLVMKRIQASVLGEREKKFVYIGDGTPDFCAALTLKETDVVMPRKNFPVWDLICNNKVSIKANIQEWSDWEELETKLLNLTDRVFIEENCSMRPNGLVPIDCKFQTSSISTTNVFNRNILQVPH